MRTAAMLALLALFVGAQAAAAASWPIDPTRLSAKTISGLPVTPSANVLGVPIVDPPTRVAGYFKLENTKAAEMFYFFFQARRNPEHAPVVLWMTGGPGCSSELAILYENGPYSLSKDARTLVETEYGWDVTHNMIFVDQPIGTGFSYTTDDADTVYGEKGVADDMLDFLQHFMAAHPVLANLPLYVTGESYAGHYVPAVSHRVWLSNKNKEGPHINLKGLAVGNGLTEPTTQFDAYGDFALQNKLIGEAERGWMSFLMPLCSLGNQWCEYTGWDWVCSLGLTYCMVTQFQPIMAANPNINVYDLSKQCEGQLCYDFTAADKFLNAPSTRAALGIPPEVEQWVSCNMDVYENFQGDWLHRFDTVLPEMMADGVRVMIYAGDLDIICNYLGNRRWVDALDWYGSDGWDDADDVEWQVAGKTAGKIKRWGPLSFVQVYKAGHMVPMDQPLNALAMITAWTRGANFSSALGMHRLAAAAEAGNGAAVDERELSLAAVFDRLQDAEEEEASHSASAGGLLAAATRTATALKASRFVARITSFASRAAAAATAAAQSVGASARRLLA